MTKPWRKDTGKVLFTRPILKHEWPKLVAAMMEDGLIAIITDKGIVWTYGGYDLTPASIKRAWGLSDGQFGKLKAYILQHDCWGSL